MLKKLSPKQLGNYGEEIATQYYQKLGYQIIGRNLHTRYGEIDLLLSKNNNIILVEVKTRRNHSFGWGEETISETKVQHLAAAYHEIQNQSDLPANFDLEIIIIEFIDKQAKIYRLLS